MAKATGMKSVAVKPVWDERGPRVSAQGIASFAYLTTADTYAGGKPTHKITVTFDKDDKQYQQMVADMLKFENDFRTTMKKPTVALPSCLKQDKVTGNPQIIFKVGAKEDGNGGYIPRPIVDVHGKPTTQPVWSGDVVRVEYSMGCIISPMMTGVKPYLRAVQIITKAQNTGPKLGSKFSDESGKTPSVEPQLPDEAGSDPF